MVSTTSRKKILAKPSKALHSPSSPGLTGAEFDLPLLNRDFSCSQLQVAAQLHSNPDFVTTLLNLMQLLQILKSERNVWETGPAGKDAFSSFA